MAEAYKLECRTSAVESSKPAKPVSRSCCPGNETCFSATRPDGPLKQDSVARCALGSQPSGAAATVQGGWLQVSQPSICRRVSINPQRKDPGPPPFPAPAAATGAH